MGRGILLYLLGVPIPIIILLAPAALDRGGALLYVVQLLLSDAALAMSRENISSLLRFRQASNGREITFDCDRVAAIALIGARTHAADREPDECGLASVYSSLSERTAAAKGNSGRSRGLAACAGHPE